MQGIQFMTSKGPVHSLGKGQSIRSNDSPVVCIRENLIRLLSPPQWLKDYVDLNHHETQ